jgi:hypothetical protein
MAALRAAGPGVSVVRAVTGMRGVGKTQLAAAYARECVDAGWRLVAWINAETTAEMLNGLAVVADRLGIKKPGTELAAIGAEIRNRLEADGERCLVVFDNATDPQTVKPYLPASGKSQVLITSALTDTATMGTAVPVDVFSQAQALAFLAARTGRDDAAGAREIARELGSLPLALAQAAALITAQHLTYQVYLDRLRSTSLADYLPAARAEPYPRGTAEAILLALDSAAAADPVSTGLRRLLIDMISLLSPTGVSRDILYAIATISPSREPGKTTVVSRKRQQDFARQIDEGLGALATASLLTFSGDGSTVNAHRLVTRVARERQIHDRTVTGVGTGTCLILKAATASLTQPWQHRVAARDLVQHVIALNDHLTPYRGNKDSMLSGCLLDLRGWAQWCLIELRDSAAQAIDLGTPLVADFERALGPAARSTITARSNLAQAYEQAGRLDDAIQLQERTLADLENKLGDKHPDTLTARSNLGNAYVGAGRYKQGIALLERTLADREQTLGHEHQDTLTSRASLGGSYSAAGRYTDAIPLLNQTLADRQRILGPKHRHTLNSRHALATAYLNAGRWADAIPLLKKTLADRKRLLGARHPDTLITRGSLASAYQLAGQLDKAVTLRALRVEP